LTGRFGHISEVAAWPRQLKALLVEELAPGPRRFWTSLRLAVVGTIGVGLVAICHVDSELGSYIVWLVVGAGPMSTVPRATTIVVIEGIMLAASVVMAHVLAETPWLMLPFVFAFIVVSTFITSRRKLGSAGLLIQVVSLASFYGVVFAPWEIGWTAAGNFSGTAIAFGLILLFDNWLWPDPAEPLLIERLGASVARHRQRLAEAVNFYLNAQVGARPQEPPPTSDLPRHLALLDQAIAEGLDAHRRAVLLAAIMRQARIQLATDRLIVAAREDVPRQIRDMVQPELAAAVDAIVGALGEIAGDASSLLRCGADSPPSADALRARQSMDSLTTRINLVRPAYIGRVSSAELANFGSFVDCLATLTRLVERPLDEPPSGAAVLARLTRATSQIADREDPMLFRYSLKVGLCVVAGYIIGIASQRSELSVILTTIVISALPTYGASLHKMILRIAGAVVGGLISLLAIVMITPNFSTLPSYLLATFIVLYVSAYSSLSSGRVAYAGKQIGTTFLLVFAGLSPSADVYGPLWRIWGILLGSSVVAIVFFIVWPEYAGASLLPRLRKVIRETIAMVPGRVATGSEAEIEAANSATMQILAEILEVADDARLEGRASLINHDAVVQAAGTLRRIANRLAGISMARANIALPQLDTQAESAHEAVVNAIRMRLKWWLAHFPLRRSLRSANEIARRAEDSHYEFTPRLNEFSSLLEAQDFARINEWTPEQRRTILSELQSLRRLEVLMTELDRYLSAVERPSTERAKHVGPGYGPEWVAENRHGW
jgi:uncharacterized membrane protein YccC